MKPIAVVVVAFLLFASCGRQEDTGYTIRLSSRPPVMDRTTPDRLVKSKWTYDVWETAAVADSLLFPTYLSERGNKSMSHQVRKNADKKKEDATHYEILKVSIESPSRATVLVLEGKDSLTYILTNSGEGWLVDDIQQQCRFCGGKGESGDFDAWERHGFKGPEPQKRCDICGGRGRRSRLFWE